MEREEVETIPWSNLVVEPTPRFDRRWIMYGAAAAAAVVAVLGFRATLSGGQPTPPAVADATTTTGAPEAAMVVSEHDLRAIAGSLDAALSLRAEWFVTDFFTNDGSAETDASIRAALHPTAEAVDLAAIRPSTADETFVEWARTVAIDFDGTEYAVRVAYRSLTRIGRQYRREPVHAVTIGIELVNGVPLVSTLPAQFEDVWVGSAGEG